MGNLEINEPMIFDGHNDVLLKLLTNGGVGAASSFLTGDDGHLDIPRAKTGGFGGGFFALYVPSPEDVSTEDDIFGAMNNPPYNIPLPAPLTQEYALPIVLEEVAILMRLQELGALKICHNTDDLRSCFANGKMAAIMHMEGAEAIDADLQALEVLYTAGLRSLGPVWSRPTIFGHGVPFKYPSTGDIGDGLSEAGFRLVKRCNQLGIMLDLSHLNEAGFWDIAKTTDAPLVATHSNAHAICPHARNLTDKQLEAIADSDGMVGLNYACAFLRPDGKMQADVALDVMLQHLDYLIEHVGEDRVGLGSDFDGAMLPEGIADVTGLNNLRTAMRAHGYDEALMQKLCHKNWLRVLDKTWGGI
ncbi:dipeptidase [Profundibacter sp.]